MPKSPLTVRGIRALAGDTWFARGEAYFQQGRVGELNELNGKLSTIVTGTEDYGVRLWTEGNDFHYSCTCPLGDDELWSCTIELAHKPAKTRRRWPIVSLTGS